MRSKLSATMSRSPRNIGQMNKWFAVLAAVLLLNAVYTIPTTLRSPSFVDDNESDRILPESDTEDAHVSTDHVPNDALAQAPKSKDEYITNEVPEETNATSDEKVGDGAVTMKAHSSKIAKKPHGNGQILIQIGANDGKQGNVKIVKDILESENSRAVLVEGNPSVFQLLEQNVIFMYDDTLKRIIPMNALVCEKGQTLPFFIVDDQKLESEIKIRRLPHWVRYQISSLNRESIESGLAYFFRIKQLTKTHNIDYYIKIQKIDCTSVEDIMSSHDIDAAEVDVVAIDTEGYDAHIMLQILKVANLKPHTIIFEYKSAINLYPIEFEEVMKGLESRGYITNCPEIMGSSGGQRKCKDQQDVIATLLS